MEEILADKTTHLAHWFTILSEPKRLNILNKIIEGVQCNCDLCESLSMSPNLVSHHISILCDSGIVKAEKDKDDARWVYYSIDVDTVSELKGQISWFLDETRIRPCLSSCGPKTRRKGI